MTLLGSKKGYSKKDINFFEGFSASARKQTQILAVIVFIGVIAVGLSLVILGWNWWRNQGVKNDIKDLNTKLASDEYAGLELRAQSLQEELNEKNQYYYTLTEMRRIVDETPAAETEIADILGDCIPSSAYVSNYTITGAALTVQGLTFSYYDAANICHLLNQSDVFAGYVVPSVEMDNTMANAEGIDESPIDVYYDFTITGNLLTDVVVSVGHYSGYDIGTIALSGVESQIVPFGSTFEFDGVSTYTSGGQEYTLTSVIVNGTALSPAEFSAVVADNKISGIANGNVQIELYYDAAQPAEEVAEEGSAE